jgi:hypothetical protein
MVDETKSPVNEEVNAYDPKPTVTFNGKSYIIEALDPAMQDMIKIHQQWQQEHEVARREVFKYEAALKGLMTELEVRFKAVDAAAAAVQQQ